MLSSVGNFVGGVAETTATAIGNTGPARAAGRLWQRGCGYFITLPCAAEVADFLREYAEEDELAAVEREVTASVEASCAITRSAPPASCISRDGHSLAADHHNTRAVTIIEPTQAGDAALAAKSAEQAPPPNAALQAMLFSVMGRRMTRAFIPAALSQALVIATSSVAIMVVGTNLGVEVLAHFSLGIMMWNMVGVSVVTGFGCALDTLCPQAYGRDPESPEVAEHFVMGTVLCVLCNVPMYFIFNYMMHDVSVLMFGESLGASVEIFLQNSSLALLFATLSMTLSKMLNAQLKADIPMLGTGASVATCAAANMYLVPRYGVDGAMVALVLTNFVCFVVTLALALRDPEVVLLQAFRPFRWEAYTPARLWEFTCLGVVSMLANCSEYWVFELLNVIAAKFGETEVATLDVCWSVSLLCFAISTGWAVPGGALIGNELGSGRGAVARAFGQLTVILCLINGVIDGIIVLIFHRAIFSLYTSDEGVLEKLAWTLPVFLIFHINDGAQFTIQAVYKATGMQHDVTKIVLVSLWIVGLPCSYLFADVLGLSVSGMLGGFLVGFVVEQPWLVRGMRDWDWEALAEEACAEDDDEDEDAAGQENSDGSAEEEEEEEEEEEADEELGADAPFNERATRTATPLRLGASSAVRAASAMRYGTPSLRGSFGLASTAAGGAGSGSPLDANSSGKPQGGRRGKTKREDPRLSDTTEELSYRLAVVAMTGEEASARRKGDADEDEDSVVSALPLTAAQLSSFGAVAAPAGGFASGFLSVPKNLTRGRVTPLRWTRKAAATKTHNTATTAGAAGRYAWSPTPLQPLPRRTPFLRPVTSPSAAPAVPNMRGLTSPGSFALPSAVGGAGAVAPLNHHHHNHHLHFAPNARLMQSSLAMHALAPRRTLASYAATTAGSPHAPGPLAAVGATRRGDATAASAVGNVLPTTAATARSLSAGAGARAASSIVMPAGGSRSATAGRVARTTTRVPRLPKALQPAVIVDGAVAVAVPADSIASTAAAVGPMTALGRRRAARSAMRARADAAAAVLAAGVSALPAAEAEAGRLYVDDDMSPVPPAVQYRPALLPAYVPAPTPVSNDGDDLFESSSGAAAASRGPHTTAVTAPGSPMGGSGFDLDNSGSGRSGSRPLARNMPGTVSPMSRVTIASGVTIQTRGSAVTAQPWGRGAASDADAPLSASGAEDVEMDAYAALDERSCRVQSQPQPAPARGQQLPTHALVQRDTTPPQPLSHAASWRRERE